MRMTPWWRKRRGVQRGDCPLPEAPEQLNAAMLSLVLRRFGAGLVVLWLVHLATFAALRAMPGDPWSELEGDRALSAEAVAKLNALYGHDRPVVAQYFADLGGKLTGDFGYSLTLARGHAVLDLLARAAPASLSIGSGALLVGLSLGVWAGMFAARRARRRDWRARCADHGVRALATLGVSTPDFIIGPVLLLVFSLSLGWLPAGGIDRPGGLVLPVLTLGLPLAAAIARLTSVCLAGELGADFVRTARAKGADEDRIVIEHALRPAFGPVLAYFGTAAASVLTGSMVVENLFAIPGLGYYFVAGALGADWTVVTGAALLYAVLLVVFNLGADLGLLWLDPRTR
jgi:oligopeptide transport system permease protein